MLFCASIALTLAARLAAAPPNVVLIISDDQAWTDFGFMGHATIRTPNLDRLANESLVFVNGYVPASLCCPSLASMVTGLSPFEHGITGNEPPRPRGTGRNDEAYRAAVREMIAKIDDAPSLPRLLGAAGYRSLQTGKWWLGDYARGGFTHGMTHGDPKRG
ncbi:MAG: sulfatase-like hydrolase/transferase, partial [Planctomycetota bacterium]